MGGTLGKNKKMTTVDIAGAADIQTIAGLHQQLLQALQHQGGVKLTVSADTNVDLTFVQLVESARRFAAAGGKTLALSAPAPAGLHDILKRGGFLTAAADRMFWLHQAGVC